ncbi:hypothetical protein CDV50_16015 [Haematobacter massiliensis]|uniref:hypothetical protein n=1 Tax=Haematobacter massiliensis TaxID=195105 RepID=UPI000B49834D|nr:hypothetical protein [Haematobacter massiliensis]OWJ69825.1 hypothetical protein CDV50_16015 [Haematobacter massiliensis]
MGAWRSAYRTTARAALAGVPRFASVKVLPAWRGNVDEETLPVLGIVTPDERVTLSARGATERGTLLQIVVKRLGGDEIEDDLDLDAEAIEEALFAAFLSASTICKPEGISLMVEDHASRALGTLICTFRITSFQPLSRG